jgi:hypothetical protein
MKKRDKKRKDDEKIPRSREKTAELFQQVVLHADCYGKRKDIDDTAVEKRFERDSVKVFWRLRCKCLNPLFFEQEVKVWQGDSLVFEAKNATPTPAYKPTELKVISYTAGEWENQFLKHPLSPPRG